MRIGSWVKMLLGAGLALACAGPSLDVPTRPAASWSLELEPHGDDQTVPLLFRGRVRRAPQGGEPWLFRGELSDYYERALKRGDLPSALRERAVPLRFWRDGEDCWLQPAAWLEPETSYALAFGGLGTLAVIRAESDLAPRARRLFPPVGSAKHSVAVVCDTRVTPSTEELKLAPGDLSLAFDAGTAFPGAGCVTLSVQGELLEPLVSAPRLGGVLLDPSPWLPPAGASAKTSALCRTGEAFHGACLEALDDRLLITPQIDDLLFLLSAPRAATLVAAAGERTALLRDLAPETTLQLRGTALSGRGVSSAIETSITTARARRHFVLNEVLANPVGLEPDAEWIELVNDSAFAASLSGLWLEDSGGHVKLPDAELGPGEFALLVPASFQASVLDVPLAEGVRLLRLANLGARGLGNGGESLLLVGPEGVISRFPPLPAPHPGHSIARRTFDGADDDPKNFSEHGAPGASPGAPNNFDASGDASAK